MAGQRQAPRGLLPEGAWTVQGRDRLALSPVEVEVGRGMGLEHEPSFENVLNLNEEES